VTDGEPRRGVNPALEFRTLERHEVESIWTIDRREVIEQTYRLQGGELRLRADYFDMQGWPPDDVRKMTPLLYESFDRSGTFYAAFDGKQLVGVAVLDTIRRGPRGDLLQLLMLSVSRDYRAQGLGGRLFAQALAAAHDRGARGLYISATPSENTIRFYQRHGCVVIATPDPELFALEPMDIHLECLVNA
jgi:predicted N-acetyltransferase YhbS